MKSDLAKVLHEVCGWPMLRYVLVACRLAGVERLIVVVGHGKDEVIRHFEDQDDIIWVEQKEQRGTGHAVLCCRDALKDFDGSVLVIAGDMPLLRRENLARLIEAREQTEAALALATTVLDDPIGYGRIMRDVEGRLEAIVEDADCTTEQRQIHEVNPSYYCFDAKCLFDALEQLRPGGPKAEYYLTDAIRILRAAGHEVTATISLPPEEAAGINSRLDLATVNRMMQDRIQLALMNEGVTIIDPDNTWIESDVTVGRETTIYPFTMIGAGAIIGDGCRIGPFARVGAGEVVENGLAVGPTIYNGATST